MRLCGKAAVVAAAYLCTSSMAHAYTIAGYTSNPTYYERFQGQSGFIGDDIDLSGVGYFHFVSSGDSYLATRISESYFITAQHIAPVGGQPITLYEGNDLNGTSWTGEVVGTHSVVASDLDLAVFKVRKDPLNTNQAAPAWAKITPLYQPLENMNWRIFSDTKLDIVTPSPTVGTYGTTRGIDMRVGNNRIERISSLFGIDYDPFGAGGFGPDEILLEDGDSGGPSLHQTPAGQALFSIHTNIELDTRPSTTSLIVNKVFDLSGEAVRVLTDAPVDVNGDHRTGDAEQTALFSHWGQSGVGYFNGDFDSNGTVGDSDLTLFLQQYGKKYTGPTDYDFDFDVDKDDLQILVDNWSASVSPGTLGDATGDGTVDVLDAELFFLTYRYDQGFAPPSPIIGDLDGSNVVDITDHTILTNILWGNTGCPYIPGDLDGDGLVGEFDRNIVQQAWLAPASIADITGARIVDAADFGVIAANYGQTVTAFESGDLDGDAYVDSDDLDIFVQWHGQGITAPLHVEYTGIGPGIVLGVPEPSTLAIALGFLLLPISRRSNAGCHTRGWPRQS